MSLLAWIKRIFSPSVRMHDSNDTQVILRMPSGHIVWLDKEDYLLFLSGNYYIVWRFDQDVANVIHFHYLHTLDFQEILIWGRDGMATGIGNRVTYGVYPYRKRQVINPDHLPYDPKMGF